VKVEAVDTLAGRLPTENLARTLRRADVVDAQAAAIVAGLPFVEDLAVEDHQALADAHFVRMCPGRHPELRDLRGMLGIAHVDDRRAVRTIDMTDVREAVGDDDLAAAGAVEVAHLADAFCLTHGERIRDSVRGSCAAPPNRA